jgi:hypothetical protein
MSDCALAGGTNEPLVFFEYAGKARPLRGLPRRAPRRQFDIRQINGQQARRRIDAG